MTNQQMFEKFKGKKIRTTNASWKRGAYFVPETWFGDYMRGTLYAPYIKKEGQSADYKFDYQKGEWFIIYDDIKDDRYLL